MIIDLVQSMGAATDRPPVLPLLINSLAVAYSFLVDGRAKVMVLGFGVVGDPGRLGIWTGRAILNE